MNRTPATRPLAHPRISTTRRAIVGTAWALAWTLVWACALLVFASKTHAAPLSLAVSDGPVSLPIYVAQAHGFFKDEGLDLQLRACRSGRECYRMLADGGVDVATAAELPVTIGSATRGDIAIIATISASSYQIKLVARRSAQVVEAPQIRGKRVGTVIGSSAQYFLDNWLIFNDIDPKTVTVVALEPDKLVAALEDRQVDAIAIWEPLASIAAAALGGDAVVFASPRVYTQHFNLVAGRSTIARREADMTRLLKALMHAQRVIDAEPAPARALLAERLHVPLALAAGIMAEQDYRVRLDQSLVTTMQAQERWLAQGGLGQPGGAPAVDLLRAIEPGPLRRAAPASVGLVQ
jgi:ABC-type nitrate/sulfonate/bicarbonate transport system substrate-binding protein